MKRIDNDWEYTPNFNDDFKNGLNSYEKVRIPHNPKDLPLHYIDVNDYQLECGYRHHIQIDNLDKRYFIKFDGVAHISTVYINGKEAKSHYCGYTAFKVEITDYLHMGDNLVSIKVNSKESNDIPPFGFVIDYLTYSGIYRDVWLIETNKTYIDEVFIKTNDGLDGIHVSLKYDGPLDNLKLKALVNNQEYLFDCVNNIEIKIDKPILWEVNKGHLYSLKLSLINNEDVIYTNSYKFGLRKVSVDENNILINNKKVFLRGLNRHQSFPYMGYAASESLQREDARILDEELGVNVVRTSHYPQSHYFIDECDKRGILVFTEIPGWQHISKSKFWRDTCLNNVEEMIKEYYNHPSIFMWGVRINESQDDDELYTKANNLAHKLDDSRPTSGVRYLEKSSLLEDVYSYNDFSYDGKTSGCKQKKDVTPDLKKPLIISEANGHMFPTKSYDSLEKRQEHALRHATVLNKAMEDNEHAGCIQWCMFDYPTHKDFGSGDKICYHGVLDSFRNPKMAAYVYASQQDKTPVLEVGTSMDIGDYPAGQIPSFYCFTNGDSIKLYKNDKFVKEFKNTPFTSLNHGPILIDDTIGNLLEEIEGFDSNKANEIRICLNAAAKYGMANLPLKYKLKFAKVMLKYHMSFNDGYTLYSKYVGNWGGEATKWKFEAIKDGKVIKSVIKTPGTSLHLEAIPSGYKLIDNETYDTISIRIRILDENNNLASYSQLPINISVSDNLEIIGPSIVTLEGGMAGTYIKSIGKYGDGTVSISSPYLDTVTIQIKIEEK